ncbi:MAG TPA: shikimate dehydrogenase [Saprospiraceae bacterium]|nr:shikimate dehydrogenase [Saprospiraceae bacterium]HMQ83111.1 shikimate dehydrogenase [Saprospiraceae bacterium]
MTNSIHLVPRLFGLIGYPLTHSFSKKYFSEKFEQEGIAGAHYELFPLTAIQELPELMAKQPNLVGLNVTIPYKEQVMAYLDALDAGAAAVGAVNCIHFVNGRSTGYNTDVYGFEQSLLNILKEQKNKTQTALVLGTGGAAKAVCYVLKKLEIDHRLVSRSPGIGDCTYEDLDASVVEKYQLIINTTPLGMAPKVDACPPLPYDAIGASHILFDLVYNPLETLFLQKGKERGAVVKNGLEMLHLQAERAWQIWNRQ